MITYKCRKWHPALKEGEEDESQLGDLFYHQKPYIPRALQSDPEDDYESDHVAEEKENHQDEKSNPEKSDKNQIVWHSVEETKNPSQKQGALFKQH